MANNGKEKPTTIICHRRSNRVFSTIDNIIYRTQQLKERLKPFQTLQGVGGCRLCSGCLRNLDSLSVLHCLCTTEVKAVEMYINKCQITQEVLDKLFGHADQEALMMRRS